MNFFDLSERHAERLVFWGCAVLLIVYVVFA
jgi:hypothetical protein